MSPVLGGPPDASQYAPGMLSMAMECADPAGAPKVWKVNAYAFAQPRVDWGDGTAYEAIPQSVAPAGNVPGTYIHTHTYTGNGPMEARVIGATGAYTHQRFFIGPIKVFDPDARHWLTAQERWQREAERLAAIRQTKTELGDDPGNTAGGGTVKDPATKQIDA